MLVIKKSPYQVLLVSSCEDDIESMRQNLVDYETSFLSGKNIGFDLYHASSLSEAVATAQSMTTVDLAVLNLDLDDSRGIVTLLSFIEGAGDIPIVVITDVNDHEIATEAIHMGAQNYILKNEIAGSFFPRSLLYAIERYRILHEQKKLTADLRDAMEKIEKLKGLIPICSHCKKIRNDNGYWEQLETFITQHSKAEFSHGICPDCVRKYFPDMADELLADMNENPGK